MKAKIDVRELNIARQAKILLKDVSFSINNGEHLLVLGKSGSGKTSLGMALAQKLFFNGIVEYSILSPKIAFVNQLYSIKSKSGISDFYYQQRYNSQDASDSLKVCDVLVNSNIKLVDELLLSSKLDTPLIQLSSGERKKIQLIQALQSKLDIIILDNPYIGLDQGSVNNLNKLFTRLAKNGTTIIILGDVEQIPSFITHIATINEQTLDIVTKVSYIKPAIEVIKSNIMLPIPNYDDFKYALEFKNISVNYGDKAVLKGIDWKVQKGEKWQLAGENGSGKTTLLSLVNGDHPQAYANEIYLFDKKRGSGESIWEIKRKIGHVSPEIYWYFNHKMTCLEVVLSGLYDTLGLYNKLQRQEIELAKEYLTYFTLIDYQNMDFLTAPAGVQRLVLVARALIKNPSLLIFDEPCQGLDEEQSYQFIQIVDSLFADAKHTIIYVSHRQDQVPKCITHKMLLNKLMQS